MGCNCKQGVLREVRAVAFAVPVPGAGAQNRFEYQVPPANDVDQYSVLVKNRDTEDGGTPVNLFISVQPTANMVPGQLQGAGIYIAPGQTYRATIPGDSRQITIDFVGLQQDFATPDATVAQISIKACGGGRQIPVAGKAGC